MPNKIPTISCGVILLSLGFALSVTPAYAGFEWSAPNSGASAPPSTADAYVAAPKVASDAPEVISPIVISGDTRSQAAGASQSPGGSSSLSLSSSPVVFSAAPEPSLPVSSVSPFSSAPPSSGDTLSGAGVVRGFALQVPLALALRQLLPSGYSFFIDQGVDMDTLVSYKGGKPWAETLKTMLVPVGLVDHVQGTVVTISRASAASAPIAYAPVALAPAAPAPTTYAPVALAPATSAPAAPVAEKTPFLPAQSTKTIGQLSILAPPQQMPLAESVPLMGSAPMGGSANLSTESWAAERGDTLHKVLTNWCRRSGVELQWLAEYDYPMQASARFNSGFEDAVRNLLSGFEGAQPQPIGALHTNSGAGQMVLVVQARGNTNTN